MALPSTDPATLVNLASCFDQCIPLGMQGAVQTYLLAVLNGLPTDKQGALDLVNAASCFSSCIPDQMAVQNYILAQMAS